MQRFGNMTEYKDDLTTAVTNNSGTAGSRPDWLLYTIPSIAFVLGVILFSLVYRTHYRKATEALRRAAAPKTVINAASTGHTYTSLFYRNEEKENYCFIQDKDYVTPDAGPDDGTETDNSIYLQPHHNLTDTDYINPDKDDKHNLERTDTESYENMVAPACP